MAVLNNQMVYARFLTGKTKKKGAVKILTTHFFDKSAVDKRAVWALGMILDD